MTDKRTPETKTPEVDAALRYGPICDALARSLELRLWVAKAALAKWQDHGKEWGFSCGYFEHNNEPYIFQHADSKFKQQADRIAELEEAMRGWRRYDWKDGSV